MSTGLLEPPLARPGAYVWHYLDFVSDVGTAVCIFMVGAPFSPRYVRRATHGALPSAHSAVNFAWYGRDGARVWVLSEYAEARFAPGLLTLGSSTLELLQGGGARATIRERTVRWGRWVEAKLELTPQCAPGGPVQLVEGLPHQWRPLAMRAQARLQGPGPGARAGIGYWDSNRGDEALGLRLGRWRWTRTHGRTVTNVRYVLPDGGCWDATTRDGLVDCRRQMATDQDEELTRTAWGLRVPRQLGVAARSSHLLESSPFYARLETHGADGHVLGEVADFARFRSPLIRWMAHFRTRVERPR